MTIQATTTEELFGGSLTSPIENPYPVYRRLRNEEPVCALATLDQSVGYLLTRFDDV